MLVSLFPEDQPVCHVPGPSLLPSVAHLSLPIGQPSSDAQRLELQNEDLVRHWLSLKPHISAAIFFDDSDHLTVLTQDGSTELFVSSPFNRQLDKCIVYLDDAHTRGTDLKLPRETRAAVTLGPKVTKDRLLQGELLFHKRKAIC